MQSLVQSCPEAAWVVKGSSRSTLLKRSGRLGSSNTAQTGLCLPLAGSQLVGLNTVNARFWTLGSLRLALLPLASGPTRKVFPHVRSKEQSLIGKGCYHFISLAASQPQLPTKGSRDQGQDDVPWAPSESYVPLVGHLRGIFASGAVLPVMR